MASSMGPGKISTDGLILHFDAANIKSYPGSGTTTTDLSSTAITASLVNGPTFSTDGGGSFLLDGTNDYIDISQNSTYQFTNTQPFTINSWVKCTNTSGYPSILAFGLYSGDYRAYYLTIDISLLRSGSFFFDYYDGTSFRGIQGITGSVTTGSWINLVGTSDGNSVNNMKVYQNGILTSYTVRSSGSPATINYTGIPMRIGARELEGPAFFKGNIAQVQIYNRALSADEVYRNYETTRERFNRPTIVTDDDARYFLNSANIGNETQQRAINELVVDMKNVGLWSKMKAIYPFVGGTATTHKWNLKDPRDVDAAFRLTFSGGWTHSSTGAKGNGSNAYGDTFLTPSTHLTALNIHASVYARGNNPDIVNDYYLLGSYKSTTTTSFLAIDAPKNPATTQKVYTSAGGIDTNAIDRTVNHTGLMITSITSNATNAHKQYVNNVNTGANTNTSTTLSSLKVFLGVLNFTGGLYGYTNQELAFATIGDGLTDTDAANLYTIVQKYQTTLGRQV